MKSCCSSPWSVLYATVWKRFLKTKIQRFPLCLGWISDRYFLGSIRCFEIRPLLAFLTVSCCPWPHWPCFSNVDLLSVSKMAPGTLHLLVSLQKMLLFLKTAWCPWISLCLRVTPTWRHHPWPSVLKNSLLLYHPLLFSLEHISLFEINFFFFLFTSPTPSRHRGCLWAEALSVHPSRGIPGMYLTASSKVGAQ